MNRRWLLGPAVVIGLLVTGCADDGSEVVTFTDAHGRVCTAVVVFETDGDREATTLDCEYPPDGRTPGPEIYEQLPPRPE